MDCKEILQKLAVSAQCVAEPDYDCNQGVWMRLYNSACEADFTAVVEQARDMGFVVYDTNVLEENTYITMTGNDMELHIYYCPKEQKLRIVADAFTSLYDKEPKPYTREFTTTVWQHETDHAYIDCGMCFMIQCADGSFFLVDSGHYLQPYDHQRIYRFMRERTPYGRKVVVNGWFITHAHDDHVCQFIRFMEQKYSDVEIEKLYFNTVNPYCRDHHFWKQSNKDIMVQFDKTAEESGIPIVKLHSGQRFYVRDLRIDVLCTHEDVYPDSLENYNDSSTVLMIESEGSRVCIPGDAGAYESDVMTTRFTDRTLHCDVMQMAHHGHFGTKTDFYRLAGAKVLLFPNTQIFFDKDLELYEANRVAIANADAYYISSNGTAGVPLPYKKGNVCVLPDETFENFDRIQALWGYTYTDAFKQELFDGFLERSGLPPMDKIDP